MWRWRYSAGTRIQVKSMGEKLTLSVLCRERKEHRVGGRWREVCFISPVAHTDKWLAPVFPLTHKCHIIKKQYALFQCLSLTPCLAKHTIIPWGFPPPPPRPIKWLNCVPKCIWAKLKRPQSQSCYDLFSLIWDAIKLQGEVCHYLTITCCWLGMWRVVFWITNCHAKWPRLS